MEPDKLRAKFATEGEVWVKAQIASRQWDPLTCEIATEWLDQIPLAEAGVTVDQSARADLLKQSAFDAAWSGRFTARRAHKTAVDAAIFAAIAILVAMAGLWVKFAQQ